MLASRLLAACVSLVTKTLPCRGPCWGGCASRAFAAVSSVRSSSTPAREKSYATSRRTRAQGRRRLTFSMTMADRIKVVPDRPELREVTTPAAATREAAGPEVAARVAAARTMAGLVEVAPAEAVPTMTAARVATAPAPATVVARTAAAGPAATAVPEGPVREAPDRMIQVEITDLVAMTTDGVLRRRRVGRE